jgi:ATP-dependent helicase HepA
LALLAKPGLREELLPALIKKSQAIAIGRIPKLVAQAQSEMVTQLGHEIARLQELQKVNRGVRAEEIESLVRQERGLNQHLAGARVRLDSIRLIQRGRTGF